MRKLLARVLVAAVVTAASIIGVQSPAAASYADCPSGVGCVWDLLNGQGTMKIIGVGDHNVNQCYNFSTFWNNKVESLTWTYGLYAGHQLVLRLYSNQGCAPGSYTVVPPGNLVGAYRNDASSFRIATV